MAASHAASDGIDVPAGPHGIALLEEVWAQFRKRKSWPSWHELRRPLKRAQVDPKVALDQLSEQLLITTARARTWRDGWPSGSVKLSLAALAHLPDGAAFLRSLFVLIDLLAEIQERQVSLNGQPATVHESDLHDLRRQRFPKTPDRWLSVDEFIYDEPWCIGGSIGNGWAGTASTIIVDHRVHLFVGCKDINDYWRRRQRLIADAISQAKQGSPGSSPLGRVHPSIAQVSAELFADGHYTDAVLRAFKAVEHRVQQVTGSNEIGQRLMNSTFGGTNPQLDVARTAGPSTPGERDGYKMLFIGAMTGLRNVRAHGDHPPDNVDEARDAIAFASLLMRRIDRAVDLRAESTNEAATAGRATDGTR
ncbi:TIGR02391 family protein [Streptomyces sp. NPDC012600]|uniref:TIGR02391 family protein n=1 Tax=Streptomyces sp. NPDC012600 TaxID=3415005 RepID=UPI003C2FE555